MYLRSFKRGLPFLIGTWVYMMRTFFIEKNAFTFIEITESFFPILLVPLCAFILYDKTEIELSLVHGTRTAKLFFSKLVPMMVYTALPIIAFLAIFPGGSTVKINYDLVLKDSSIQEYIPANFKLCIALSVLVTLTFFFALFSFIRVITRNCYITMLTGFGVGIGISGIRGVVCSWKVPFTYCMFDPMIDTYFIGNELPLAYAEKYPDLAGMTNIWTYNRLLFVGVSLLLFFITYLVLRHEKLHCSISE